MIVIFYYNKDFKPQEESSDMEKTERYKEIYEELKVRTNPLFSSYNRDKKEDLGELIENLASLFSKKDNRQEYTDFIKEYDRLRNIGFFRDEVDILSAIKRALQYSTKRRK